MKIPAKPPGLRDVLSSVDPDKFVQMVNSGIGPAPEGKYRHWDTVRRMRPPDGLSIEEYWTAMKMARLQGRREIPLQDKGGRPFIYTLPDPLLEMLHRVDRDASGQIALPEPVTNPATRDRYIQNSLIEEAFTSSVLEGAVSTREAASEMIRSGREPINTSERMILNNFRAMQRILQLRDEPLSPELILTLHEIITHGTLKNGEGALRTPGDGIGVYDNATNTLLHSPPHASEIPRRMEALCRFANEQRTGVFLHPVVKAITLHFWLAYDHPFVGGNGRTARALFYWSMLSQGFWLFEYVSISTVLRKVPARYGRSFLYTETDDNDLTYFILSQLRVICRAIDQLHTYVQRKVAELRETSELLRRSDEINHRQLALLSHALRHPGFDYTISSHKTSHRVTYQTARTDLLDLAEKGLLVKRGKGRGRGSAFSFRPAPDLGERLSS